MIIGIDGSRAFLKERTGIEEYSYQVIKNLVNELKRHEVILYIKQSQKSKVKSQKHNSKVKIFIDGIELPERWRIKIIKFPYLWTQVGLSLEMLLRPVDTLFIPAHIVPIIHTKNTVVVIHGLEYEFVPEAYPLWERIYMRFAIKKSCRRAKTIIAVSNNTKKDLINLYKVPAEKIKVIYEGYDNKSQISNLKSQISNKFQIPNSKFLLFIGRLEERKNIVGIVRAFEILKEKYKIPHKLILAGKSGFGYAKAITKIQETKCKDDIILTGFVSEEEKRELLKNAEVFLFPTFYEGFGLPILEAQNAGVPLVASTEASIPEVANEGALLVDPNVAKAIAEATSKLIADKKLRDDLIKKGRENVRRFSWEKCAKTIAKVLAG